MDHVPGLLLATVFAVALLATLRWIFGSARRRGARPPSSRPRAAGAWGHVGARQRDLASTASWQIRIR